MADRKISLIFEGFRQRYRDPCLALKIGLLGKMVERPVAVAEAGGAENGVVNILLCDRNRVTKCPPLRKQAGYGGS